MTAAPQTPKILVRVVEMACIVVSMTLLGWMMETLRSQMEKDTFDVSFPVLIASIGLVFSALRLWLESREARKHGL